MATKALDKATSAWSIIVMRGITLVLKRCWRDDPALGPTRGQGGDSGEGGNNGFEWHEGLASNEEWGGYRAHITNCDQDVNQLKKKPYV
jgi:hypothetical protein